MLVAHIAAFALCLALLVHLVKRWVMPAWQGRNIKAVAAEKTQQTATKYLADEDAKQAYVRQGRVKKDGETANNPYSLGRFMNLPYRQKIK